MKTLYLKDVSTGKQILGAALIALGMFSLITFYILPALFFIFLGAHLLSTDGVELDIPARRYREIKRVFGTSFGKWKPVPAFEYVSAFRTKENQTVRVATIESSVQTSVIHVNLFYPVNRHITVFKTTDPAQAIATAQKIGAEFSIDVLDATTSDKKWL